MPLTIFNRAKPTESPVIVIRMRRRSIANFRQLYFAQAAEAASRYGVEFERVLKHLWRARRINRRFTLRSVRHADDLVHAVACIDGTSLAWADLAERYERPLIRSCRSTLDESAAVMLIRRMFLDIRCDEGEVQQLAATLHAYIGDQSLSDWLDARLCALRMREAIAHVHQRRDQSPFAVATRRSAKTAFVAQWQLSSNAHTILPFPIQPGPPDPTGRLTAEGA